jgi:hypothetical protein
MNRALRYVLSSVIAVGWAIVPATVAGDPEPSGLYEANGVNPDGTQYRGFVHIVRRGESFLVSWIFPQDSPEANGFGLTSVGVGILSDGVLAVSYYGARSAGVAVYRIDEDGKHLAGHWTVAGEDGSVHAETLTRLPARPPEPLDAVPPDVVRPNERKRGHTTGMRSL